MANRFYSPNQQFSDATGAPYAGGSLAFYASGTSTPLATYSDSALTIPNTNPVVLDSAGRAGNIFLQNLAYKVVLSDVNSNVIWTDDPVYSSDYSTRAKLLTVSGSPNGNTAGTAGSAGIGADVAWDSTNNILYVCTQTGTSSTAVWTAVNSASAAAITPAPQGYLTPTSGTPVISTDAISATQIYYTPYVGNLVPVYSGSTFVPTVFAELSLALVAQHAASTIYDVFVFNNSGVLTLATGPAWSVSTAGAGDRGTGAGTTQLSRLNGLWVNTVSMTGRNGSTTYTIPASQGTYVGSILIDSTPGQVTCHRTYGTFRKWGIWNAYNRVPISIQGGDTTTSWVYTSNGIRPSNNSNASSITTLVGLPEEQITVLFNQWVTGGSVSANNQVLAIWQFGIGWNVTNAFSGQVGTSGIRIDGSSVDINMQATSTAKYIAPPAIGINTATSLEFVSSLNNASVTWNGTSANMVLAANYRG